MKRPLLALIPVLVVTACLGSDFADSIQGKWILESGSLEGEPIELTAPNPVTLELVAESISGTAACNGYQGEYRVAGSEFEILEGLAVNSMACSPEEIMITERRYLDALLATNRVSLDDGRLVLSGAGSELVFVTAEGGHLTGELFGPNHVGSWQLLSGEADGVPIPLVEAHPVTLEVETGSVGGTSACNHYGVELSEDGQVQVGGTDMACEPEVMESEQAYLEALTRARAASLEEGRLVIRGDGIELVFAGLEPAPLAELVGTEWVLESLIEGDAVSSASGERATLLLEPDGTFRGSTGCREVAGEYVVSGAEVVFTSWGAEGDCPAELADQDDLVVTVLGDGFRAEIEGGMLTLWSRGNDGLVYRAAS